MNDTAIPKTDKSIPSNTIRGKVEDSYLATGATFGLRFDTGKNRLELIPPEWMWALGDVLTHGAAKYADRNWEKGMAWSRVIGSMFRHAYKFMAGERYDPETGCHHMAMVAWNALALMSYDLRNVGENDLPQLDTSLLEKVNESKATKGDDSSRASGSAEPIAGSLEVEARLWRSGDSGRV